jgi:Amt family ammonium transporter
MDGTLAATSRVGQGSTFTLTIPLDVVTDTPQNSQVTGGEADAKTAPLKDEAKPIRVLIVEDNETNQIVTGEILRRAGFCCDIVENGRLAIEAVTTHEYDLVLMDCEMPEMDGFTASRRIRDLQAEGRIPGDKSRLPIIALTAHAIRGDSQHCLDAGMDAYVSKPFDSRELIADIRRWVGRDIVPPNDPHRSDIDTVSSGERVQFPERRLAHNRDKGVLDRVGSTSAFRTSHAQETAARLEALKNQASSVAIDVGPAVDLASFQERCLGNTELMQQILRCFRDRVREDTEAVKSAIADNDWSTARQLTHGLKGAAANVSAHDLCEVARQIETHLRERPEDDLAPWIEKLDHEIERCLESLSNA